jgi:hypothetical protein
MSFFKGGHVLSVVKERCRFDARIDYPICRLLCRIIVECDMSLLILGTLACSELAIHTYQRI